WVRNALVFGAFVPLTSAGDASLWIGNNPHATGNWEPPPPALHGTPELAYGRQIGAIAVAWIKANPAAFVHLTIAKLLHAGAIGVFGVARLEAMRPPLALGIAARLWPLAQGLHLAMLSGATLAARLPGTRTLVLIVAACIAQWLLFGMWFEFGERHREFATPFLLLLVCRAFVPAEGHAPVGKPVPTP
ncbi:MAG: glycosyltransferase, partial [Pseudomonadota bacterium]|nr:glycosyltransferase [Pseudomonadota bacterium]